ncbi:hypothetical protein AMTRI_Chr10g232050 [Amborella trichopoda]
MERGGFQGLHASLRLSKSSGSLIPDPNLALDHDHATPERSDTCSVREQDRFMPIANVIRIMRKVLPTHAKISDDAKETIQECVSEYISFITSEANDRCQREQRKTITAEDVLWAMNKLGFDDYVEPLNLYLQKYREVEGDHRGSIRGEPLHTTKKDVYGAGVMHAGPSAYPPGAVMYGGGSGYYKDHIPGGNGYDPYAPYK